MIFCRSAGKIKFCCQFDPSWGFFVKFGMKDAVLIINKNHLPQFHSFDACEQKCAMLVYSPPSVPNSAREGGLRLGSCVFGHGINEVWKRPDPGVHEPCLRPPSPNKEVRGCIVWL